MPSPAYLLNFKQKVENAVSIVASMSAEQKLEAVQFWNIMSEKLQEIVNHSAADISALSLKDPKQASEYVEDASGQTYHLLTSTSGTGDTMALITTKQQQDKPTDAPSVVATANMVLPREKKGPLPITEAVEEKAPEPENEEVNTSQNVEEFKPEEEKSELEIFKTLRATNPKGIKDVDSDPEGTVECEQCHKFFTTTAQLAVHKWCHIKPYICAECDARFSNKGNLIIHTRSHTGERPYKCNLCAAKFSTRGNLKRHDKSHSGDKPFPCLQCPARFTEKKSLNIHMRRHTGERPYKCTMCPKAFSQKGILQTHMALHLNQKAHLCDTCGKSFRQKSQLRLHKLRHNNVKRFTCTSCPAQFLTKGDMQRHKRTHTGERPFNCGLCKKTFTRQQTLTEHMNRHYGLKPYLCKYCRKAFAEMSACYKHIKTHEREIPPLHSTPKDGVIVSAAIARINEVAQAIIVEQDSSWKYPDGLEVGSNELVESSSKQGGGQMQSTIKSTANSVLCRVESNKSSITIE